MALEELVRRILECDENIQHVGIVDNNGKIIRSDIKIITSDSQQLQKLQISYDLNIVKGVNTIMDDVLGETHMIIQVREKTYLFIYYYKNCLFYVACRKNIDPHRMIDVANSIKTLLDLSPDI